MGAYGRLTVAQREALRPIVRGRTVHDLGAGSCALSMELAALGAAHVVAIDRQAPRRATALPPSVLFRRQAFEDVAERPRVAFLSWPSPEPLVDYGPAGIMRLVRAASVVVYLGRNRDRVVCGGRPLFEHFAERELTAYIPARRNDLLVLGRWHRGGDLRPLTAEEEHGLFAHE